MEKMYDMIIVGGGPAGLSSAIYMARAKYKTLVLEKEKFGGQITITSEVVNYPGVFSTSGSALTKDMQKQAQSFGAEFKLADVTEVDLSGDIKVIKTTKGEFKTLGVILAPGAHPRKVGFEGELDFQGRGVAYCATCDGEFFQDQELYVVGGGFAAVEESIFLTKYASKITMLVREDDFTAAKTVVDHLEHEPKITALFNQEVISVAGDASLNEITIKDNKTGEVRTHKHPNGFGVFVFAGYVPNTTWLNNAVALDRGYIVTDEKQRTNVTGVYGAGDVCIKDLRQVVTAVSDGAIAATTAEKYVEEMHTKLNLPPFEIQKVAVKHEETKAVVQGESNSDAFLDNDTKAQLLGVFEKFDSNITIRGVVDQSSLGLEIASFGKELNGLSPKVVYVQDALNNEVGPYLEILDANGQTSGIKYYAMPGGHEFNSFVIAMYNVAGPGQEIDEIDLNTIQSFKNPVDIKVLISLSCTMCPDVVKATQKMASLNSNIQASAIDIAHFSEIKSKYNVMSVPCMIINDEIVHFGKKTLSEVISIVEQL